MLLEFTPKDWFMMRIGLVFAPGDPDPEDAWVRAYLQEHQLVPRLQAREERDGVVCEVQYFGQCYLGRHVQALQDLYRRGIERSLLVQQLRGLRQPREEGSVAWPVTLDDDGFEALLPALAEALHDRLSFTTDDAGYLTLTLDPALVASVANDLTAKSPAGATALTDSPIP